MLKLVTVLFADLVSSTPQTEGDPEHMHALLSDFFATMAAEIHAEGGAIEKYIGDAIMAVFGVPVAHEDDAARAVRAGRRMLTRLREWNAARGSDVRIRIGINTGEVLASGASGDDLMITGDAVNAAARLEHEAPVGAILIGERTAQAARREFDLTPLGPLQLRGISRPMRAWVVIDERRTPEPEGVSGLTAPMVGRDVELGFLQTLFDRTREKAMPQLVTIVGDAGIGKSRLAREFCASIGDGADVLVGRCLPYGEGVTLWPLGEILKGLGGILETDPPDVAFAKIEAFVRETVHPDLAPEPQRTAVALASTIGLRPPIATPAPQDPREAQRDFRSAWRALAASAATRKPLVIVIEDIHWADRSMLATIEDLASHVEGPLLLVTTARPETLHAHPDWGGGLSNYSAVRLEPLPREEGARMLRHLFELDELPLAVALLDKAEGNPFFLEEILRGLVDTNRLRVEGGLLRASNGLGDLDIPDTVQAMILARIDLLAPDAKRALQLAAVIGRTFWRGALERLVERADLDEILSVLVRRGLIRERLTSSVGGEVEYTFRHVLIQEVAYDSVPRSERARAHAAAAHWIEATSGARREELAELLAHHYVTAHGILDEDELRWAARSYCLIAARSAFRRFAIAQAETFGWLAVDLSLPGTERVFALESLGDLYAVTSRGDAAWRAYADAIRELEQEPEDKHVLAQLTARAATLFTRRQPTMVDPPPRDEVARIVELGLHATAEQRTPERAELLAAQSYVIALAPEWDAQTDTHGEEAARDALAIAEEIGDPSLISSVIDAVGLRLQTLGLYGEIYVRNRRRLELVSELTDSSEVCDAYVSGAWSSTIVGHYDEAVEHATRCIEISHGVDEGQYVHGLVWRIAAAFRGGEWDSVLADQAEIERHVRDEAKGELPPFAAHAYATAFFCRHLRGDEESARSYFDRLRDLYQRNDSHSGKAYISVTGRTLVHQGRLAEAEKLLGRIVGANRVFYAELLADVVGAREDWDDAARAAQSIREAAARTGITVDTLFADRLEGQAALAHGDREAGVSLLRRSAEGFDERGAPWEAARSWALAGDAERALEAFEQLGAVLDAAACRQRTAHAAS